MEATEQMLKVREFASDVLDMAGEVSLTYEELFSALTQVTAAVILDYAAQGTLATESIGNLTEETFDKYVEFLKGDVQRFQEEMAKAVPDEI